MAANVSRSLTGVTPEILKKIDDYIDKMDNTVTNEKVVLEGLVVTIAKQASTIATKATNTLALSD